MAGFTLLELLVVTFIAVALIVFLSALYRVVGRVAVTLEHLPDEWRTEQFMRRQYLLVHPASIDLGLFEGAHDRLTFVSYRSARHGEHGPPVAVRYRFDAPSKRLLYQERDLPPWWDGRLRPPGRAWLGEALGWWEDTAFHEVASVEFSYLAPGVAGERWREQWTDRTTLPQIIRVRITRTGERRELVLETAVLSSSMPSGY